MFVSDGCIARRSRTRTLTRFFCLCLVLFAITFTLWLHLYGSAPVAAAAPRVIWPSISLQPVITSGLFHPVAITHAGDGSNRLFVVEQPGKIRIYKNGSLLSTPFLDLSATGANRVQSTGFEQGLLSVAFPPNYATKGYFYVNYTSLIYGAIGDTVIARYRLTSDPDVADPNSEQIILTISQPEANHNGGQLQFGPDGFLYIGMGDGGGGGDNHGSIGNGQDPAQLLGKILRINVEPGYNPYSTPPLSFTPAYTLYLPYLTAVVNPPVTYTIPITNPFVSNPAFRPEIWALGVRNPWRFSFDRQTRDLYIADVGQNAWEEVDFQAASSLGGENYGWRILEGPDCFNPNPCSPPLNYSAPITYYSHSFNGPPCTSITGGYVYHGAQYSVTLQGIYFYGDYCTGRLFGALFSGSWMTTQFTDTTVNISTFGEDQAGELYIAGHGDGVIYKIQNP